MVETYARAVTFKTKANVAIKVLPRNPRRIVWSALNLSDTEMFFGYDQSLTGIGRPKGWRIAPGYGSVEDQHAKDDVFIWCAAGGKEITIQEVTSVE